MNKLAALLERITFTPYRYDPRDSWFPEAKAGDVFLMSDGRRLLAGHINELGGTCNDCHEQGAKIVGRGNLDEVLP